MAKRVVLTSRGEAYIRPVVARRPLSGGPGTDKSSSSSAATPVERSETRVKERVRLGEGQGGWVTHPLWGGVTPTPSSESSSRDAHAKEAETRTARLNHLLDEMTAAERIEALDRLALRNQLTAKSAANVDLDMWAEAIKTALGDTIGTPEGQYGVMLVKRLLAPSANWRPVESFMASSKLCRLQRTERLAVYHMLARLLVEDADRFCDWSGVPMSARIVAQRTDLLAGVFEAAFPGYLASGLAPLVARQMMSR